MKQSKNFRTRSNLSIFFFVVLNIKRPHPKLRQVSGSNPGNPIGRLGKKAQKGILQSLFSRFPPVSPSVRAEGALWLNGSSSHWRPQEKYVDSSISW